MYCSIHTNAETKLSCTRCGRPACSDCLIPASVGFHCRECVGSQPVVRIKRNLSVVTLILVSISVVGYLLQQTSDLFVANLCLIGDGTDYGDPTIGVYNGQWYRLFTIALVHGGILHLLSNMFALWVTGVPLEHALGKIRLITIYLVSLLGGSLTSLILGSPSQVAVGASGAIFGLFGATLIVTRKFGGSTSSMYSVIGVNLVLGFLLPNVDWHAHVGGLAAGCLAALALIPKRR